MPPAPLTRIATFLAELKRRKVYQVTAIYVVLAIGGLELLDLLIPATSLPEWAAPLVIALAIVGLPTVVVLAWTFDITPGGVVRTPDGNGPTAPVAPRHPAPTRDPVGPEDPDTRAERTEPASPGARAPDTSGLDPLTVAVLPFDNLSASPEAEPFALGLHDDLLTELSRASALTVISRTSVRAYRDTDRTTREIARELGAGTIVEAGVQMAGGRVRLNVQLIDARTDVHRWAERYDRELSTETIFELQSDLAANIMRELQARLTAAEEARSPERPTDDLEAYRLYALGRDAFVDRSERGMREAVRHFERAIDRDPEYAAAWAGLGMASIMLVDYAHADDPRLVERGKEACFRAVALDPRLAEAQAALGNMYGFLKDAPRARKALAEAQRLSPGLALGYQRASWIELMAGDPAAALAAARRATQLAPLEPEARSNLAMGHMGLGNLELCASEATRALESHPDFAYPRWILSLVHWCAGRDAEAIAELAGIEEPLYAPWPIAISACAAARRGDSDAARSGLGRLGPEPCFKTGLVRAALGDFEGALTDMRQDMPLFWDDALAFRYLPLQPLDRLRNHDGFVEVRDDLNRGWGV